MKKHILVTGAGIAGLTAANFLAQQGHCVTLVDRSPSFSKAGFLISLKSFGVKIMDELGLSGALQAASSPSETVDFVETNDTVIQHIAYDKMNENIERSVLISRGGLHQVLYEAIKNDVHILFDTTLVQVNEKEDYAEVELSNGSTLCVDLIIVSEGLRSATRQQYFDNVQFEDFNMLYVGGKLRQHHHKKVGAFKIYIDVDKMLSIYPIAEDEIAIQCYIRSFEDLKTLRNSAPSILKNAFGRYNAEVNHLLDSLLDEGLFFIDKMGMVHTSNLLNGRMVLLGDAGYCPTALSGMGASLSIYGAKALAHYIALEPDDLPSACQKYNHLMQPVITKFQGNAKNNALSFLPENAFHLEKFVANFRNASFSDVQKIMTDPIVLTKDQENFMLD
ncbi:FAD-dependent monooxygenase [Sphingobacterium sp. 2149]|uniref:FAD-dependent oxidoreductase n=1 Tax=Sphingobacterium sp. 2149 TaxID=2817763 RepID=UPI0028659DC0|nr:FAD-dependent monooxygenase [Sphingobacterium sp. 2149]MDR6734769.1 2-polyprenyl-6-methoxyphenol hydroxylase-like FAD-dependent oxidoreductase [Sphingobacterium sp. 2149]